MKRLLAFALLLAVTACGVQPPPSTPTPAVTVTFAVSTLTPIPTITVTLSPLPTVTVTATPEPGGYRLYSAPREVGTINVLSAVCHAKNSWWDVTPAGMTFHADTDAENECVARGQV